MYACLSVSTKTKINDIGAGNITHRSCSESIRVILNERNIFIYNDTFYSTHHYAMCVQIFIINGNKEDYDKYFAVL